MAFRIAASIDANQHKGLILLNSVSAAPLVATGLSLTNAQPMHVAVVDGSGSQITTFGGMVSQKYDYIAYTSGSSTDTYVFKSGGAGGTTVATIVITYTDNTKAVLSTVAKT